MRNYVILVAAAILAGCAQLDAAFAPDEFAMRQETAGQPEAYRDGYVDGCTSGINRAGNPYHHFRKDSARYVADRLYATGWDDGDRRCKNKYDQDTGKR